MQQQTRKRRKWDDTGAPSASAAAPAFNPVTAVAGPPNSGFVPGSIFARNAVSASPLKFEPVKPKVETKPGIPPSAEVIARAQQGAALALEKINRDLLARGLLDPHRARALGINTGPAPDDLPAFGHDVTINDAPPSQRFLLTKRTTQEEIQRRTGTTIINRGRYTAPGEPPDSNERPLFLRVAPGPNLTFDEAKRAAVTSAVEDIQTLIACQRLPPKKPAGNFRGPPGAAPSYNHMPPPQQLQGSTAVAPPNHGAANHQHSGAPTVSLFIGFDAPPEFNLAARLQGHDNAFFDHIAKESSAVLQLRGRGVGGPWESGEAMHVYITSGTPAGLAEAKSLTENLLETVKADFKKMYPLAPLEQQQLQPQFQPPTRTYPGNGGYNQAPPPYVQQAGPTQSSPYVLPPQQQPPQQQPPQQQYQRQAAPGAGGYDASAYPPAQQHYPPASSSYNQQQPPQQAHYAHEQQQQQPLQQQQQQQPLQQQRQLQVAPYATQGPPQGATPTAVSGPPASQGGYGGHIQPQFGGPSAPPAGNYWQPGYGQQQQAPQQPGYGYGSPGYGAPLGQYPTGHGQPQAAPYSGTPYGGVPYSQPLQTPPYGQQAMAAQQSEGSNGGYGPPQQQQQQQAAEVPAPPQPQKRRFREFKEGDSASSALQQAVNPYHQHQQVQQQPHQDDALSGLPQDTNAKTSGTMGPPPPRPPGGRPVMGPPPPRPPRNNQSGVVLSTGLGSLVDYD